MSASAFNASDSSQDEMTAQICDAVHGGKDAVSTVISVALCFNSVAIVAVILRFVTVRLRKAWPAVDDWVILAALVPCTLLCLIVAIAELDQNRRITRTLTTFDNSSQRCIVAYADFTTKAWPAQWSVAQSATSGTPLIGSTFHTTTVALVKSAVLLTYGKIFAKRSMRMIVKVGQILIIFVWLPFLIYAYVFIARSDTTSYSADQFVTWLWILIVLGAADLATDLALLVIPAVYIAQLNMSVNKKVQCIGIFGVGIICIVASIARLVWLSEYLAYAQQVVSLTSDSQASMAELMVDPNVIARHPLANALLVWRNCMIWTFVEPCTSILAACLPTYRPLVDHLHQRVLRQRQNVRVEESPERGPYDQLEMADVSPDEGLTNTKPNERNRVATRRLYIG